MQYKLLHGDSLEQLKKIKDNQIDSIVTDPPYGLSFMGKKWDYDVPQVELWKEVFRVLKPGGHLLSFAGTRTYHRMAVNIEDAGFEIRDMISWLYGSGFPKSLNIGKAIDKIQGNEREVVGKGKRGNNGVTEGKTFGGEIGGFNYDRSFHIDKGTSKWEGYGTAMKPSQEPVVVAQKPLNTIPSLLYHIEWQLNLCVKNVEESLKLNQAELKKDMSNSVQKSVEQKNNTLEDLKDVMDISQSEQEKESIDLNMILSWKRLLEEISIEMNKSITLMEKEMTTDLKILNSLLGKLIPKSTIDQQKSLANGLNVNVLLVENTLKSVLVKSKLLNTTSVQENVISKEKPSNLSPNNSPIVVARKPLSEKNIALNVLKHGTGGINIDGCRVGSEVLNNSYAGNKETGFTADDKRTDAGKGLYSGKNKGTNIVQGRFPANIILDEEAGKILDEQTEGKVGNGHWSKTTTKGFGEFGGGSSTYEGVGKKDKEKGGASRFFYCAKASKSERNFGLDDFEEKVISDRNPECYSADVPNNRSANPKKNFHPTVKPIKLMQYLVRLVTPKGAICLDPFMGSGTTGIACQKEQVKFVGIEREEEYLKIAQARIEATQ